MDEIVLQIIKFILECLFLFVFGTAMLVVVVYAVIGTVGFWASIITDWIIEPIQEWNQRRRLAIWMKQWKEEK